MRTRMNAPFMILLASVLWFTGSAFAQEVDRSIDTGPAFHPDGSRIMFSSARDGDVDLYEIRPDGSGLTRITNEPGDEHFGRWSPDGSLIAFYSNRDGDDGLYVMNADGSGLRRLAETEASSAPSWSPDGRMIAFQRHITGSYTAPDGSFRRPSPGDIVYDVVVVNVETGAETNLTDSPAMDGNPVFSPDGRWIAFASNPDNYTQTMQRRIFVMRPDGTDVREVGSGFIGNPQSWTPDGRQIAAGSFRDGNPELYLVDVADGAITRLTERDALDFYALVSPDGRTVLFTSTVDENQDLYLMDIDGSNVRRLTTN